MSTPNPKRFRVSLSCSALRFHEILGQDAGYIGTDLYSGLAYFWAYKYRHTMRDASPRVRCLIYDRLRKAGLPLDGATRAHDKIFGKQYLTP